MGWTYDQPPFDFFAHEGWVEPLLQGEPVDVPEGETWRDVLGEDTQPARATSVRAVCACGWQSETHYAADVTDRAIRTRNVTEWTDSLDEDTRRLWWTDHIQPLLVQGLEREVDDLLDTLNRRVYKLIDHDPTAALRCAARIEAVGGETVRGSTVGARTRKMTWADIGPALGVSSQAAHQRLSKYTKDPVTCPPCRRGDCEDCMAIDHAPDRNPWRCPCHSGGACPRPEPADNEPLASAGDDVGIPSLGDRPQS